MKKRFGIVVLMVLVVALSAAWAEEKMANAGASLAKEEAAGPIQDNSFLMEEAYNQEFGVVQHINTFARYWTSEDWAYSFTQEWPGWKDWRNQYSYTIQAVRPGAFAREGAGMGDVLLNYRRQLVGDGEARVAFAPRVSLIVPAGESRKGRGFGGAGVQVNLPLSVVANRYLVTHWNAGTTLVPRAKNEAGEKAFAAGYNLGASVVWLATARVNFLVEGVYNSAQSVVGKDKVATVHSALVSPGVRWAYNFKSGLQIVPGVAVPLGVAASSGERGVLVYLSFEHPFRELKK